MEYRPKFCCQDWRSHPPGFGLDGKSFGGTFKKAGGGEGDNPVKAGKAGRSGVGDVLRVAGGRPRGLPRIKNGIRPEKKEGAKPPRVPR